MEKIPAVDILLVPVGGKYTIDAEAASKIISALEPGIVIPMHFKTPDLTGVDGLDDVKEFLDEMGIDKPVYEERLKVSSRSDIPEETQVVILKQAH